MIQMFALALTPMLQPVLEARNYHATCEMLLNDKSVQALTVDLRSKPLPGGPRDFGYEWTIGGSKAFPVGSNAEEITSRQERYLHEASISVRDGNFSYFYDLHVGSFLSSSGEQNFANLNVYKGQGGTSNPEPYAIGFCRIESQGPQR